jgi:polysaccharide pyruvyl transferase WcaK-like protein
MKRSTVRWHVSDTQGHDTPRRVLLLDYWSDRNRGDAAMQIAMIRLLREELPGVTLSIMTAYGLNQWPHPLHELDESGNLADEVVGGFQPTAVHFESTPHEHGKWRKRAGKALNGLAGLALLPIWLVLGRLPLLDPILPREVKRSLRAMRSADLVIWNGRNFRSDAAWREPYDFWDLLYNPMVAFGLGKPVASVGASIWPVRNPLSRVFLREVLGRSYFVSLREQGSYDRAVTLLRDKPPHLALLPDLSLAVLTDDGASRPTTPSTLDRPRRIAVTLVDSMMSGEAGRKRYLAAVHDVLRDMLADDETEVIIVPQVTYEARRLGHLAEAVMEGLDTSRVTVLPGRPTVQDLVRLYDGVDLLIATRMHSAIFALTRGIPVVTIPYDAGGKWGILDMMGAGNLDVPYSQITPELLSRKIDEVWSRRLEIRAAVDAALPALANDVRDNVRIPLALYSHVARGDQTQDG